MNRTVRLKSGADLLVTRAEPPLPAEAAAEFCGLVGRFLREECLPDILRGAHSREACFIAGTGRIDARLVATCWAGWGRRAPEIAVMAGVSTAERFRGQGIATAIVGAVCEEADAAGVRFLYLGTTNPDAQRIYERLGFKHLAGHIFCRRREGADESERLAPGQRVTAGPADWGDMAAIVPLCLHPHPAVLVDAAVRLPTVRVLPPWRCVRIFWELWAGVQNSGRWQVLRTPAGWVVASAIARLVNNEFVMDFFWHSDYSSEGQEFVRRFVEELERDSDRPCALWVGEGDDWKQREAERLGFAGASPAGAIELRDWRMPLLRLTRRRSS